ncbi:FAD-binding oxidoreductase [Cyanobium sp. NIES-981]|uniref:FAD-binding oxidoreductase n=1 Tax=Cyanobium sp. NIES-981 TaxID=1851505 RepID=UPI0007DDF344|nr:FAD-binding oxidoreductase [Cyanobium sp. NIES-981]SBO43955.1 Glycolate oxidase chain [Cyanobium sp. NIES-981]
MITPEPRELPHLVQDLHQRNRPWLPAGLASRLDWGPPVARPHTVLSCARLNRILEHNPGDFTITVEAGTPLVAVQQALQPHGQWLPLDWPWGSGPAGEGSGSIGGLVARGQAGGYRQRYLGVRDQMIGIHLLRSDGVAARAGGKVVKNVAGYDLMRLLCGSWGSLALITAVTLRTQPIPPHRQGLRLQGPTAALAAFSRWLLGSSLSPERIDWQRLGAAGSGAGPGADTLLISLASISAQTLQEQIACIEEKAGAAPGAAAGADSGSLLVHRLAADELAAAEAPSPGAGPGAGSDAAAGAAWLLRLGVRPERVPDLLTTPALAGLELVLGAGSGLGHAWGSAAVPVHRVEALRRHCREAGGMVTVLRQPGGSSIPAWLDAPSRPLIEAVKRQFDPKQQLARGRLPGVEPPGVAEPPPAG